MMRTPMLNALVETSCSVWLVAVLSQHHLLNDKKRKVSCLFSFEIEQGPPLTQTLHLLFFACCLWLRFS